MIKKYLRTSKNPNDKQLHLERLINLTSSHDWEAVLSEMEDMLIKEYLAYSNCKTYEDFIQIQANVHAIQRLSGLNGLSEIIKQKRIRASKQ